MPGDARPTDHSPGEPFGPVRAVLFDWDGTLVRHERAHRESPFESLAAHIRAEAGFEITAGDLEFAYRAALPEYVPGVTQTAPRVYDILAKALASLGLPAGNLVESCAAILFRDAVRTLAVYDDARALLASLRFRGYATAVVTNAIFPAAAFEPKVRELGLGGYIDVFVSSADVGLAKPNPAPYLAALSALGLGAHEAIFVGDTPATDIAGARAAGIRAVLLQRESAPADAETATVIQRLTALNAILGENPAR